MERNLAMARRIARMAEKAGGRVYFVGGFVRDSVMGRESKDVDIEIHGMTADAVRKMLGEIGPWKEMGASFGVFALRGYTLDIALPRRGGLASVMWTRFWRFAKETGCSINTIRRWRRGKAFWRT